jgi:hypothetical protein
MHEDSSHAWKRAPTRWRLRDSSRRREAVAIGLNLGPVVGAALGFVLLTPAADWSDPALIAALCGVAAVAFWAEVRLRFGVGAFYGATFVAAFVALIVAGALPALLVWLVPDVISRYILRREPRFSPGLVATASSYALAVLVGSQVIELAGDPTGPAAAPTLYAAGLAMWLVNFIFARLTFAPFYQDIRPRTLIRDELSALAPTAFAMLAVGVVAGLMVIDVGVWALALLAVVICLPQIVLERIVSSEPAARLDRVSATRLYADAIADVLELPRGYRREIACAAELMLPVDDPTEAPGLGWRDADISQVAFLALHSQERWSGGGWPAGLPAEAIPHGSRVLAVASAWAQLTASGTLELSHSDAILSLSAEAGSKFDPAVVEAAARVVGDEQGFVLEPAFQPKLHRIPGPRALRRGALPGLLPRPIAQ